MAFNEQMIEEILDWCVDNRGLGPELRRSRQQFFAEGDPRPLKYWPGAEGVVSRERRFLGYFMFDHRLSTGETPAEAAVGRLYSGAEQAEALKAVRGTRFVFAAISSVIGRSIYLEIEDESLEVRSSAWSGLLHIGEAVVSHVIPIRHGYWLPGPGWLVWPTRIGPGMGSSLKEFQMDPLTVERFLEGRSADPGAQQRPSPPRDKTLKQAVDRMTEAAQLAGLQGLVMSTWEWEALVCIHLQDVSTLAFAQEVIARIAEPEGVDELQGWLDLAMNIWNNTPQPDRGGKSAQELYEEFGGGADRPL